MWGTLKKFVRRYVLHTHKPSVHTCDGEKPASWYEAQYADSEEYRLHYTASRYFHIWSVIVYRIRQLNAQSVLEIGCGSGQLAEMLFDHGIRNYVGIDFSRTAIQMARNRVPAYQFLVDNALTTTLYASESYEVILCTEVLEHIEQDLAVVEKFPASKFVMITVPNFPFRSHVRHFADEREVLSRYGAFFVNPSVFTLRGMHKPQQKYFLLEGTRKAPE
jgi:SAM-dependent methyltransferase